MNFSNKLELVLEVFEKSFSRDYVEGVKKKQVRNTFFYEFSDPSLEESPEYTVTIVRTFKSANVISSMNFDDRKDEAKIFEALLEQASNMNNTEHGTILTDYVYGVSLTADDSHKSTGRSNWTFVYGKMLECLIDFMDHNGTPAFITFTGYETAMDPVYARLVRLMDKNIGVRYRKLTHDTSYPLYVLDDVVKALSASGSDDVSALVGDVEAKHAEKLKRDKRGF